MWEGEEEERQRDTVYFVNEPEAFLYSRSSLISVNTHSFDERAASDREVVYASDVSFPPAVLGGETVVGAKDGGWGATGDMSHAIRGGEKERRT